MILVLLLAVPEFLNIHTLLYILTSPDSGTAVLPLVPDAFAEHNSLANIHVHQEDEYLR